MFKQIMNYGKAEITYNQKKMLSEEPILRNLFWETTLRCNANCKHCGSRAGENIKIKEEVLECFWHPRAFLRDQEITL